MEASTPQGNKQTYITTMSLALCKLLSAHLTLVLLSATIACLGTASGSVNHTTNTPDQEALLCFKSHLSQSNRRGISAFATWSNGTLDFCRWQGVLCSRHGPTPRVDALYLEGEGLIGQIPSCISNLTYLSRIHLPANQINGVMPPELGQLRRLQYINLSFNTISGVIPADLPSCSHLQVVDLTKNNLGGGIPAALFNSSVIKTVDLRMNNLSGPIPHLLPNFSTSLQFLGLTGNSLSGDIPSSLGTLSSLVYLLAAENQLIGSIPDSLARLPNIQVFDFTYNFLSGTFPDTFYNLSSLIFLGLANNSLAGKIPSTIGNTLPNIKVLSLSANKFHGEIPKSLANATNLVSVFLDDNTFHGIIPSLGYLKNLQTVSMSQNHKLEAGDWGFLSSLINCTQLAYLIFDGNNLHGDLPSSVANLSTNLEYLVLGLNHITGTIPSGIGNLVSLSMMYLDNNSLTGPIPDSIGKLHRLNVLNLSKNRFSGQIPTSLGNLDQLTELYLQENSLSGAIPANLAGCKKLLALNLSSNTLGGQIPNELFRNLNQLSWWLDLSNNQLTHSIPDEVGSLINLASLNISNNNISGRIPSTLGSCALLITLRLEGNILEGHIPPSLTNLKGVNEMDFSRNNLSGEIPEFLELFNSLMYLNLSFNNLDGPIPTKGIFANATSRLSLQGNPMLCASSPMLQLPLCSAKLSRSNKLLVPLLAVVLSCVAVSVILVLYFKKATRNDSQQKQDSSTELKMLSYNDISKATNGFSSANLIGSGQSSLVYKGTLYGEVDQLVAVKVFKLDLFGESNSFISECTALRNARHRNLVKVITACSTCDHSGNQFKALILEYMEKGTLDNYLHTNRYGYLSLSARISIAVEIASVLDYLHNWSAPPLVHCDLKPSNILFDDCNVAHVADFGLARFLHGSSPGEHQNSTSLIGARGSLGYIAPEYGMGSRISPEGDVYSYGIVLMEMLTGKCPTNELFKDGFTLHSYVQEALPQIGEILDRNLIQEIAGYHNPETQICILRLLNLALLCSEESPQERPGMQEICCEVVAVKEHFLSL
ncbi:unnamed protein product [Urochloa decumbens]|uniref:Receptor kinase-like protein Xa21 n=1 Tax=Urochloa decumbens TaxID=240449 RepID=A0ABC8VYD1_9POAL